MISRGQYVPGWEICGEFSVYYTYTHLLWVVQISQKSFSNVFFNFIVMLISLWGEKCCNSNMGCGPAFCIRIIPHPTPLIAPQFHF